MEILKLTVIQRNVQSPLSITLPANIQYAGSTIHLHFLVTGHGLTKFSWHRIADVLRTKGLVFDEVTVWEPLLDEDKDLRKEEISPTATVGWDGDV